MKGFRLAVERLNLAVGYLCGMGILVMCLILVFEVVCRYSFNSPTIWAQEISIYIYTWVMMAGGAYTLMKGKHVRIDVLMERLPRRAAGALEIMTSALGAIFCAIVSVQAWEMMASSFQYGKLSPTLLRIPMWIPQTALLLGFVLLTLQFIFIMADRAGNFSAAGRKE
jgi:TRAP-type C4-dicarboxylate transport system permease small subunit